MLLALLPALLNWLKPVYGPFGQTNICTLNFYPNQPKAKEWLRSYCLNILYTVDVRETGMFSNHKLCMYFFHEKCLQLQPNDEPFPFTLNDLTKTLPSTKSNFLYVRLFLRWGIYYMLLMQGLQAYFVTFSLCLRKHNFLTK